MPLQLKGEPEKELIPPSQAIPDSVLRFIFRHHLHELTTQTTQLVFHPREGEWHPAENAGNRGTEETEMLVSLYPSSSYVKNFPRYCVVVHDTSPDSFSLRDGDATISPYLFLMTG